MDTILDPLVNILQPFFGSAAPFVVLVIVLFGAYGGLSVIMSIIMPRRKPPQRPAPVYNRYRIERAVFITPPNSEWQLDNTITIPQFPPRRQTPRLPSSPPSSLPYCGQRVTSRKVRDVRDADYTVE